jgi:cell fate regulator YaaT (PSP1 superfamily)
LAIYGKPRFLGIVELHEDVFVSLPLDGMIIAVSHRGEEAASVMGPLNDDQEREYRGMRTISEHGEGPARGGDPIVSDLEFVRILEAEDRERYASRKDIEEGILKDAQEMVELHHLELKLIDAETMMDGKKLFFYFTSETRVDFRMFVKDLARKFRTRIELRQIGVRDEARIISGMASCGLPCCCSYWLNQFAPIGIKMVKEQNIALNPAKISGICGRLMCCMSFEHKVYKNLWTGLPGPGSKIKTPKGNYVVAAMDIGREAVRCHKPGGGDIVVPISLFQEFRDAVMNSEEWELPESEREAENERAERKKHECLCRRNTEFRGSEIVIAEKSAEAYDVAAHSRVSSGNQAPSGEARGGAEAEERRHGHRRGRRGGRRRKPEAESIARPTAEVKERFHRPKSQEGAKDTKSEGIPDPVARAVRRRRRRPKLGPGPAVEN